MALIAWYPLNGDTKDYSGNDYHLTNNANLPVSEYGKIGKTYDFNLKKPMIYNGWILPRDSTWNDFTITAWIYPTETPVEHGYNVVSFGSNHVIRFRLTTANTIWVLWGGDESGKNHSSVTGSLKVPLNKWSHVTVRLKDGKITIYINGIKDTESSYGQPIVMLKSTLLIGSYNESSEAEAWRGRLNDIRIYNEALTAKQIKEISQAKICHYTFNEELYENTTNLYDNKNKLSITNAVIKWENTHALKCEIAANTKYTGLNFNSNLTLEPLTTYTLSYKLKKVAGQLLQIRGHIEQTCFEVVHTTINGKKYNNNSYYSGIDIRDSFDTYEIIIVFNTKENITSMDKMYIQPNAIKDEYVKVRIWDIQVEKKDHATPFTTGSRSQVLKDISGYGHDMTTYNQYSPVWNKDDSSNRIKNYSTLTKKDSYSNLNFKYKYPDAFTFSCWVRTTNNEAFCLVGFPSGNNTFVSLAINNYGRISLHSYFSTPNTNGDKWYANSTTAINNGEWHFVAVTYDGTTAKSYVDGKYEASSTVTFDFKRQAISDLTINMGSPNSNWGGYETRRYEGDISDVRVYATALSAEDIKLLYQPEISIDKANVIRCSEINERNKIITESIEIVSAGYIANQNTYKVSIGDRYTTTIRETGWGVTEIDKDNNISYKTFATHSTPNNFNNLKTHVSNIPSTSTILLSTYDQPAASPTASNNTNCMNWINYLRSIGSTKLSGDFVYRSSYAAVIQGGRILEEVIDNSGMDSKIILNTNIELEISQNGFNKDASISFKEFNEIPEIKSGIHNLKLGDQILPVLVDMDNDGGRWARVFYHNCKSGTVLFSSNNSFTEAKETNTNAPTTSDKYSILSKLESFRPNTNSSFEFKLKYPTDTNGSNIWKQTSNPTHQKVTGYKPIKIDWTHNYWGGLEYSGNTSTLIDGSANHNNWFYAIGAASKHGDGIPSCTNVNNNGATANDVELWVRINNYDLFADNLIENVSMSKNGVLTAKEFREI